MISKDPKQIFIGLSTDEDEMPSASKLNNGAIFIEMDTSKIYFYDADSETWLEWGS